MNFSGVTVTLLVIVICFVTNSRQISPKLDFTQESRETTVHTMKSPKIQGVRVTVDTTKIQRSAESRSDEKDSEQTDGKKKVGIRTDITFEIDESKSNSSSSSNESGEKEVGKDDDDDSSVPIFKGKPASDDKNHRNHHHNPGVYERRFDRPVFHPTDDETFIHSSNDWNNFIPRTGVWTTERSRWNQPSDSGHNFRGGNRGSTGFHKGYDIPYHTSGGGSPHWKDCDCKSVIPIPSTTFQNHDNGGRNFGRHGVNRKIYDSVTYGENERNTRKFHQLHPGVDDKLEEPFKVDKK